MATLLMILLIFQQGSIDTAKGDFDDDSKSQQVMWC